MPIVITASTGGRGQVLAICTLVCEIVGECIQVGYAGLYGAFGAVETIVDAGDLYHLEAAVA